MAGSSIFTTTTHEEGKITFLHYKTIIWREREREREKWNLGIKLTLHALSWLKLMKIAPNFDFESRSFHSFSVNEELQNNELDLEVDY